MSFNEIKKLIPFCETLISPLKIFNVEISVCDQLLVSICLDLVRFQMQLAFSGSDLLELNPTYCNLRYFQHMMPV